MGDNIFPVVRARYIPGRTQRSPRKLLHAHVRYLQYRKLGTNEQQEDRAFFNAESDHVMRHDIVNEIMDYASASVRFHKIVLSPAAYEGIDDFQEWTRAVMQDLSERKGLTLHWYAVVHSNEREQTNVPHVHVVLAGAGEDPTGTRKTVSMMERKGDYLSMRKSGREHSNFEFTHVLEETLREIEQEEERLQTREEREPSRGRS